jgi:NADH dehydrogenase
MMIAMGEEQLHVVTGAFGYLGRYIANRLLGANHRVRTLTNSVRRDDPFDGQIEVHPLCFQDPQNLTDSLRGASVLFNTYWVRFNHRNFTHAQAVDNTRKLFDAARQAGVGRIVHVSITNPSEDSPLEYFRGKAQLERALLETGVPCSILRPAVLFGKEDILINNIAWALRRFPFFGVFGDGNYRLQPIYVDDLASLAVSEGRESGNRLINAIGPETYTYRELVQRIGEIIGKSRPIVSISPGLGYLIGRIIGWYMKDVMITRDEVRGLMDDLLCVDAPPAGTTALTTWAREHANELGQRYASELARRTA